MSEEVRAAGRERWRVCVRWTAEGSKQEVDAVLTGRRTRFMKVNRVFDRASRPLLLHSAKDIKHKISFLLQKPEPQAAEPEPTGEKTAAPSRAAKRSGEALRLGSISALLCFLNDIHPFIHSPVQPFSFTRATSFARVTFDLGRFRKCSLLFKTRQYLIAMLPKKTKIKDISSLQLLSHLSVLGLRADENRSFGSHLV